MQDKATPLSTRIKLTRKALDLSAAELCLRINCKPSRWSPYESGERPLTLEVAIALCDEFGLSLDWLYRGDPAQLPHALRVKMQREAAADHEPKLEEAPAAADLEEAPLYVGQWISACGFKPADVSRGVPISEGYLSLVISGRRNNPSRVKLTAIAQFLRITVADLHRPPPPKNA